MPTEVRRTEPPSDDERVATPAVDSTASERVSPLAGLERVRAVRVGFYALYTASAVFTLLFVTDVLPVGSGVASVTAVGPGLPWPVYAFTLVGTLTHVFVTLTGRPELRTAALARLALRVPLALALTWALYSLLTTATFFSVRPDALGVRGVAVFAFLVGLFVEHAVGAAKTVLTSVVFRTLGPTVRDVLRRLGYRT
ncbi:hypothetical protein [Halogeometricum limi]|uniref:Uncharacterized protein n=1 Tax=Halogeometricum limi TaxID=555875 RepID=A0A1I6IE29_9EURY|nr:hypothetical protein [Halogeometricum limi]SFR64610.1 hypothetical protein SAMN04488124_3067 [Halogeometricum limi]